MEIANKEKFSKGFEPTYIYNFVISYDDIYCPQGKEFELLKSGVNSF